MPGVLSTTPATSSPTFKLKMMVTPLPMPMLASEREEVVLLKRKLKSVEAERDSLKSAMYHSGFFDADATHGLIKKKGRPNTNPSVRADRVRAAASLALHLGTAIQGPAIADNMMALVKQASALDPSVPQRLLNDGMFPEEMVCLPDKRFKAGVRREVKTLVSDKNGFLFVARSKTTASAVHELRDLGGTALISTPEMLQKWAMRQATLPAIKFLLESWPIVWVPPIELFSKLFDNPIFSRTIRLGAPFNKQQIKMPLWLMVTITMTLLIAMYI